MAAAEVTTDHDFIKKWVEERGGSPASVKETGGKGDPGIIRIDFPGFSGEGKLEPISWEDWFDAFEANRLAFLYQEEVGGAPSRFNKLVSRDSVTPEGGKEEMEEDDEAWEEDDEDEEEEEDRER
jgi:hypothetical protein